MSERITGRRVGAHVPQQAKQELALAIIRELIERLDSDFGLIVHPEPGREPRFAYHFHVGDECLAADTVGNLPTLVDAIMGGLNAMLDQNLNDSDDAYQELLDALTRGGLRILPEGVGEGERFLPSGTWAYRWMNGETVGGFATVEAAVEAGVKRVQPRLMPRTI